MFFTKADNNATVTTSSASWVRTPATAEDLRRFQVHQTQAGMQPPSSSVSTLRFFFSATLRPARSFRRLTISPSAAANCHWSLVWRKSHGCSKRRRDQNARLPLARPTVPSCGVSEIVALKVTDIDSARMLIRFEQGRGRKDRHAMLSP